MIDNDVNINEENKSGKTALIIACEKGNEKIVKCLIENKADINKADETQKTPLIIACEIRNKKMVEYLLEKYMERKKAIFKWYKFSNEFIEKIDKK